MPDIEDGDIPSAGAPNTSFSLSFGSREPGTGDGFADIRIAFDNPENVDVVRQRINIWLAAIGLDLEAVERVVDGGLGASGLLGPPAAPPVADERPHTFVGEADLAGQSFVETRGGSYIFRLRDGRYHVVSTQAVPTLDGARSVADGLADAMRS